jgi:hypothetical protein
MVSCVFSIDSISPCAASPGSRAAGGLLVLVEGHHVHRAHLLDALAQPAAGLLFGGQLLAGQARTISIGAQQRRPRVDLGQAACLQVLQIGAQLGHFA